MNQFKNSIQVHTSILVSLFLFIFSGLLLVDLFLPYRIDYKLVNEKNKKEKQIYHNLEDVALSDGSRLEIIESTPFLRQAIYTTYNSTFKPERDYKPSLLYAPGIVFIIFAFFGSAYGLFFPKPFYLFRRTLIFNLICGGILSLFTIFSLI